MPRTVFCTYLKREAEGLDRVPYPGELGKRIYENISAEAWRAWVAHQTMLLNEYRLSPIDPKARKFLVEEMEKFLFGDGSAKPDAFVNPEQG
jgi:Fe-S cluster biosynthesis and repair protein YggX